MYLREISEASTKIKIIFIYLNDIFAKIYSIMIHKIYILFYGIKLSTKFSKAFYCKQSRICKNDINEAKYVQFSQVSILLLKVFKKQFHIYAKLVKYRSITIISIIMYLSLTR